jgi:UDP-hydrolysing UDP-N-acetyl-D-glucosamine 2-epimerase
MHLSHEFGYTVDEIRQSGYTIRDEVEILLSSDSAYGTAKSVGVGVIGFADCFRRLAPDILVVLGDRFESFAATIAAMLVGVPLAHIHGGERTEGLIDEPIRHSISKMSHLHFVATDVYRRRVIQLGEDPRRVFNVGAIGLDRIDRGSLTGKEDLSRQLGVPADLRWCLVTYHPVTLDPATTKRDCAELLAATRSFPDLYFIFTKANADEGGRLVNTMIEAYVGEVGNSAAFDSLGSHKYLSAVASAEMVLGNSSSGIIEAPFLCVPTVDIGVRQQGRVRGGTVTHVEAICDEIRKAVRWALGNKSKLDYSIHPYYHGGAANRILAAIKSWTPERIKTFYDLEFQLSDEQ